MTDDLILPRRLAITLLHAAQLAQPAAVRGVVLAHEGRPATWLEGELPAGATPWARLWSVPTAPAVPTAAEIADGGLHLVISLNIKGVLEMRAWQLQQGQPVERRLKVRDVDDTRVA